MTRTDLVDAVYHDIGFSRKDSAELVNAVFDLILDRLADGEMVKLSGFGNFILRDKRSRVGRNPKTGVECEITARKVLVFKSSRLLRNKVNASRS